VKTYAPKTKALAADVVLTEAVKRAVALMREANRSIWGGVVPASGTGYGLSSSGTLSLTFYVPLPAERDAVRDRARQVLLAAARSAELLLERAS